MKLHLQKNRSFYKNFIVAIALVMSFVQVQAQNDVYWREGFEVTDGTKPSNTFPSGAPTAGSIGNSAGYFVSNAGTWYQYGAYRSNGPTGSCTASSLAHARLSNQTAAPDSPYIVTPIVGFGIKELHFYSGRASRGYTIFTTDDTLATTTNWSKVTYIGSTTTTCVDVKVDINSATAKRVKIVCRAATDSDIDSIWLTSVGSIPVEMVSFTGKKNNKVNELTWKTASELNNKGYQIERSQGLEDNWQTIGFVGAKGKAASYTFQDENVATTATFYYRLRQMDFDGTATVSKVIAISDNIKTKLTIYPSVTTGLLTIEAAENSTFQVVNLLGQTVLSGKTAQRLDVSALPQGTYLLRIGSEQAKFVKQ